MTLKGRSPLPKDTQKLMGKLMQLHLLTHPERIAAQYGVTAQYVRHQWRQAGVEEFTDLQTRLKALFSD